MASSGISDSAQRQRALDPANSFIVQAPAGSGKTELLIQRYLTLLALVDKPEEIIAITFTRKAAGEMRDRILTALEHARSAPCPDIPHERLTWELASKVLARDSEMGWALEMNPRRLRIQTIDALSSALTRQMPVLSRFGAPPGITEDAVELYREAARRTITEVETGEEWSPSIEYLLRHLDNNLAVVEALIMRMLARRDQWLRHIADPEHERIERSELETALASLITDELTALQRHTPDDFIGQCLPMVRFAASNLEQSGRDTAIRIWLETDQLPDCGPGQLDYWLGIAQLLLTNEGKWRKAVNTTIGFPPASKDKTEGDKILFGEMKQHLLQLIDSLLDQDELRRRLHRLRELPPVNFDDNQWQTLEALFSLLRLAVAQLELVFREQGQVDYTAMAQGALQALGEPDNPNDLALSLDYRLRHVLVDEFQDTSFSQYQLIERLTAGWQLDDGRSLFVVGDPMQSIYRFREAEVGLYLQARKHGIRQVALEPLTLAVNFRSNQGIVDWINNSFPSILPVVEDIANGGVTFTPSTAYHDHGNGPAVTLHPYVGRAGDEAEQVVALVQEIGVAHPGETTAILVRSRSHLLEIIPRLRNRGLKYQAIEIEHLGHRPVAQDLFTLTCALTHLGDRIAWLALLRAPWCGLTLVDLERLAGRDQEATIWSLMLNETQIKLLSPDGKKRLLRVQAILKNSLDQRQRLPLRRWVEGPWLALGGPACLSNEVDLEDANAFLELLEHLDQGGGLRDRDLLLDELGALFAKVDVHSGHALQIMTIHKAKGLEFDTVIIPGLEREPGRQGKHLLMWLERPRTGDHGSSDLLLAPIKESGAGDDLIYKYLCHLDRQRGYHENGRLLYVAATRARSRLHLLGRCQVREQADGLEIKQPPKISLLHQLWPVVAADFDRKLIKDEVVQQRPQETESATVQAGGFQRLTAGWALPAPPASVCLPADRLLELEPAPAAGAVEYLWAGETAKHIGIVVHRLLQQLASDDIDTDTYSRVKPLYPAIRSALFASGVGQTALDEGGKRVLTAIQQTLSDQRGLWILDNRHRDARSEYALSGIHQGRVINIVIDRTFIDEDGTRWIIDYKTGVHTGGELDEFLDREQERYQDQLARYAAFMRRHEDRPIKLGLYFPLLQGWREWPAANS